MARKTAEQRWRERYSKASSRLRSQIRNLEKRYPESKALERGGIEDWGGLKTLPKDYSLKDLKRLTEYAEKTLRSGRYSLQRHRRTYANASLTLKQDYGVSLDQKDIGAYFRFRDEVIEKGLGSILYNSTGRIFKEAKKRGLNKRALMKNIRYWAKEFEKAQKKGESEEFVKTRLNSSSAFFDNKG